ncbi:hypothetical protein OG552_15895 [Streptomyces sp. NBC_01476]|uniref:hypothetical protein n=1 Tax=Streptomyces sp. NBC_01476 TaxID=2903881 RepID=UPI002E31C903|nr:hypothetical protein [Streptomyces sp. NBC_01476]
MSRRSLLSRSAVITGAALAASLPIPRALAAPGPASRVLVNPAYRKGSYRVPPHLRDALRRAKTRQKRVMTGQVSRNGWPTERAADAGGSVFTRPVPGVPLAGVAVRMGDTETVLVHVVRRFHYEIDTLRSGDVVGWRSPSAVRASRSESNQASGTAVRIRPDHYPPGAKGGFYPLQVMVIRDILAELEGVVRWGGDDRTVDESLFYLDVPPGSPLLTGVARKIWTWGDHPGQGAGSPVDVMSPSRRRAADALAARRR